MRKPKKPDKAAPSGAKEIKTAGISLPKDTMTLLRRVAFARSLKGGGRASVSAVLASLVERHRAELEREAKEGLAE